MVKAPIRMRNLTTELIGSSRTVKRTLGVRRWLWRPPSISPHAWWAWAVGRPALLLLLAYAVGWVVAFCASEGLRLALNPTIPGPSPLHIEDAVTVTALLLTPRRRWWPYLLLIGPLILIGDWLLGEPPFGAAVVVVLSAWVIFAVVAVLAVSLLRRFVGLPLRFASVREVGRFIACVAAAAAVAGLSSVVVRTLAFGTDVWFSWPLAFLGHGLGIVVFTPAIVLWLTRGLRGLGIATRRQRSELELLVLATLALSLLVFATRLPDEVVAHALVYTLVPILVWAAVRFGPQGLASTLALATTVAIIGATLNRGPFVGSTTFSNVVALQLFLLFVGVPLFFLTALVQERQEAVEAQQASETRYRTVVRTMPNTTVLLFDAQLRHRFADGPGLPMLGLTAQALEGRTVWEAFPNDLAAALAPLYQASLVDQSVALDVVHADQTFHVEAVPIPAARPASGAPQGTAAPARVGMVVLRDVTEQRRARDELERARTRAAVLSALSQEFRTLAENSPVLIARLDPDGRLRYVNQAGVELLGLLPAHGIGRTIADLGIPPDVSAPLARAVQDVVETRAPRTFDIDMPSPDGQVHALHVRVVPERTEDGALLSTLVIATDVSALREVERLREEWTSVVAHDLRQPTTVILGYGSLLEKAATQFSLPVQLQVSHILDSARLLSRMIRDLLDSSRIETRRLTLERQVVDLAALVPIVVERAAEMTRDHVVTVAFRSKIPSIMADPGRIEQVLTNLLSNAAKYGDPQTAIEVSLDVEDDAVKVGVTNRGPGIRPEEIPTLFNRFIRTRNAQQRTREGLGLGLYIARGLIEAHGGRIWVESTPGETTTFWFTLRIEHD
jgi:PAS domain S-box-containing protein